MWLSCGYRAIQVFDEDRNDQVFIAFLGLVGTTLEDMAKLDKFEPMIAKLESVSNRICSSASGDQNRLTSVFTAFVINGGWISAGSVPKHRS